MWVRTYDRGLCLIRDEMHERGEKGRHRQCATLPALFQSLLPAGRRRYLVNRLQFLAGLEAHGFAGRNGNFGAGARVASDAGFAGTDVEYAESAEFDAISRGERFFHALENGLDREFGFGF